MDQTDVVIESIQNIFWWFHDISEFIEEDSPPAS